MGKVLFKLSILLGVFYESKHCKNDCKLRQKLVGAFDNAESKLWADGEGGSRLSSAKEWYHCIPLATIFHNQVGHEGALNTLLVIAQEKVFFPKDEIGGKSKKRLNPL